MKKLFMMIGAAAIVAMADVALATDIDSYLFRYDFSAGTKVFHGSDTVATDPLADKNDAVNMTVLPVEGPDGPNTAVHPLNEPWSTIGSNQAWALFNNDWTCAMSVRPGSTQNGVIFSIGRKNAASRKNISICASSDTTRLIVDENQSNASNKQSRKSQIFLDQSVDVSKGFHTVVVVYKKPESGNAGTLDFYVDGVFQKQHTTVDYEFGGAFGFSKTVSGNMPGEAGTKDDLDVAFRDVRFYSSAFTSTDARRYAALYPAGGKLRKSAFVRAYGANAVDTGYSVTPQTRIGIDCQYTDLTTAKRMFGAGEYNHESLGCAFYIQSQGNFAHIFNDGYDYTESSLGNSNDATRQRVKAVLDRPAGYSYLWKDGAMTTDKQTGTASGNYAGTTTLPLFAEKTTTVTQNWSKAMIYSVDIQESGRLVHFFAPHLDATHCAGFMDVITGEFKGEAMESPTTALTYNDGFGSSADYRYDNEKATLYAKVYADSADAAKGAVAVSAGDETLTPEEDGGYWVAYGTTLTLAATPESGYAFAGWAGDVNAIQSGTTAQTEMTILVERATQFEARFALDPDAKIFHTAVVGAFAKRAQDFDTGDYVQTGLVLHFDGKRNAGADAAHSDDATTWANLGTLGSANDATLSTLDSNIPSGATEGAWGENGYNFGGKNYFAIPAATLGGALTVQVAADYDNGSQKVNYPAFFGATSDNNDQFGLYFNRDNSDDAYKKTLRFKLLKKTMHAATSVWSGPFATAIYDISRDASQGVSVGDAILPQWQKRNASDNIPSYTYAIGTGRSSNSDKGARMLVGTVKSVRVYTQVLDDDALVWNRFVDDVRFRDGGVDVDFVVAANPRGLEGVEPAGDYMVNGSHTFTATNLTNGVFTWSPAGYTLEKWDSDSRTWKFVSDCAGSSYAYVNTKANGKMRLSWIWEQTGAVKGGYEPGDYVQNGLLLHFDGIRNAGAGAAHSDDATTWANLGSLGGGKNATLTALASSIPSGATDGAWVDGGYRFRGKEYFAIGGTVALGGALTVQIAADYSDADQVVDYPSFFGQISEDQDNFAVYFNRTRSGDLKTTPYFKLLDKGAHGAKSVWAGPFATAIYDTSRTDGVSIGNETLPQWQKRNPSGNIPAYSYAIGCAWKSDSQKGPYRMFVGTTKSVRVYNRVLSDFALTHNRAIDQVRFNGNVTIVNGAVGETGTVGSSTATDGVYDVASGTWTVTAADVSKDGRTYKPYLTVEKLTDGKWEQTEKRWTDSYTVDKAKLDSSRIRLTWTWAIRPGLLISFH